MYFDFGYFSFFFDARFSNPALVECCRKNYFWLVLYKVMKKIFWNFVWYVVQIDQGCCCDVNHCKFQKKSCKKMCLVCEFHIEKNALSDRFCNNNPSKSTSHNVWIFIFCPLIFLLKKQCWYRALCWIKIYLLRQWDRLALNHIMY